MPHAAARAHRGSYGELGGGFFMIEIGANPDGHGQAFGRR
jgi:hypothetical protein